MCGIVGFIDKLHRPDFASGALVLRMLQALACRGPDSAGMAILREREPEPADSRSWMIRVTMADRDVADLLGRLNEIGTATASTREADTLRVQFAPQLGVSAADVERALGAQPGGLEVLSLGERIDLVKQVGSPDQLEAAYHVSTWRGPLTIGHTRMSTESRVDLSHSQPFWAHGVPDLATVHNGHVTNYHQLRRRYEQSGARFYTENDSEVIGVYLRERLGRGRSLPQALEDAIDDLDGAYNFLVLAPEGLGVVRDRFGFKPLMIAETDEFVAVATEEQALRQALPGHFRVSEPPPGEALFFASASPALI